MTRKHSILKNAVTAAVLSSGVMSSLAFANDLTSAEFAAINNDSFEIVLNFSEGAVMPKGYSIEQPARLVFDFDGVASALNQRRFDLGFSNANNAVVLETDDRLRMVLALSEIASYETIQEGNRLRIVVGDNSTPQYHEQADTAVASFTKPKYSSALSVQNIEFNRDNTGSGTVTLSLSDEDAIINVDKTSRGLEVQVKDATIPSHLTKLYDVTDFATPVSRIQATNKNGNALLILAPSDDAYDYLAYQVGNQYQISMTPVTKDEADRIEREFSGERISFNFQNVEIRTVLQILAEVTNLNLVVSDTVTGNITLNLDNVPWDQALDLILKTKSLDKRLTGNVLMVAPAEEIAQREQTELQNIAKLKELAPLVTEHIRIKYAEAQQMYTLFADAESEGENSILSDRGRAVIDDRTNSIIITDTASKIEEFKALIDKLDIPIRQVSIESRIVIAGSDARRDLGIRWGFDRASSRDGVTGAVTAPSNIGSGSIESVIQVANGDTIEYGSGGEGGGEGGGNSSGTGALAVDLGATPESGNPANIALGFLSGNQNFITLELSALEAEGMAQVVSQPKVITGDKQKAKIESGSEIPYQQASSSGATNVQFKEAVLSLEVTPQITPDNRILMDLRITKDSIGQIVAGVPTIDVTQIETKVYADNGQTIVLGGIFETSEINNESGVPLLKDLPGVGRLFKRTTKAHEKTETLIFITPRILNSELDNAGQPTNVLADKVDPEMPTYYK